MKLLTVNNAKTVKGEKLGWLTGILHLAPARLSGHNVCPRSTVGCRAACLNTAGRGRWERIQKARIKKTKRLFDDRKGFIEQLNADIEELLHTARRQRKRAAVRLNGTSDIPWETAHFGCIPQGWAGSRIVFYDYCTDPLRILSPDKPDNYYMLFSRKERNEDACFEVLRAGFNVAVVFDKVVPGAQYLGHTIINGDEHDLRFIDPSPRIVGVKAKGRARHTNHGFVVQADTLNG